MAAVQASCTRVLLVVVALAMLNFDSKNRRQLIRQPRLDRVKDASIARYIGQCFPLKPLQEVLTLLSGLLPQGYYYYRVITL